jgi:hypothetical protein
LRRHDDRVSGFWRLERAHFPVAVRRLYASVDPRKQPLDATSVGEKRRPATEQRNSLRAVNPTL